MKAVKNIFAICCIVCAIAAQAQQGDKLSFSGGALVNTHFKSEESFSDEGHYFDYYAKYHYNTTTGYFIKAGYDKAASINSKWSLLLPMSFSYLRYTNSFRHEGASWGCFGGGRYDEEVVEQNTALNFSFGTGFQYQSGKLRLSGNLLLNTCYTIFRDNKAYDKNYDMEYKVTPGQISGSLLKFYAGSHFSVMHKVGNKLWVGPSLDVFIYNIPALYTQIQAKVSDYPWDYSAGSPSFNLSGKNMWFNPGLKIQIDL